MKLRYKMIFVTLGSQKFQFNRLLKKIDELCEQGLIQEEVFAQIGTSDYEPKKYEFQKFLDRNEFQNYMNKCEIVITHGGTGAIITAVKKGKKVIAVPRLAKYGEHVDDHQIQLIEQFDVMNLIMPCYDIKSLGEKLQEIEKCTFEKYQSNTSAIIDDIKKYLRECGI